MGETDRPSPESTGIAQLDQILGGLFIGDNVIWYDDAGLLQWGGPLEMESPFYTRGVSIVNAE